MAHTLLQSLIRRRPPSEVLPELVQLNGDGAPESVAYEKIGVLLLDVLRQQEAQARDHEQRIAALSAQLA